MTKVITVLGIAADIQSEREERLLYQVNDQMSRLVDDFEHDAWWRENIAAEGFNHWRVQDIAGLLLAMFYMDIVEEPVTDRELYISLTECRALAEVA